MKHQAAGLKASGLQGLKIAGIQRVQQPMEGRDQLVGCQEIAVGKGCGGKAIRNLHPLLAEFTDHFPQGGVFAADLGHGPNPHLGQGHHQG
jgi:hypothetical protein